jgi:hypothetical protein
MKCGCQLVETVIRLNKCSALLKHLRRPHVRSLSERESEIKCDTNAQAIVRICQLVGGMPLGILLAAAWVEVLSPDEIVTELSQGFDFLAAELRDLPERQRSMRQC